MTQTEVREKNGISTPHSALYAITVQFRPDSHFICMVSHLSHSATRPRFVPPPAVNTNKQMHKERDMQCKEVKVKIESQKNEVRKFQKPNQKKRKEEKPQLKTKKKSTENKEVNRKPKTTPL
jgi:hypothetical protein